MSSAWPYFALALAAALLDVTLGYPRGLARAVGTPSKWLANWLLVVREAAAAWPSGVMLAIYLAPVGVGAAILSMALPDGPIGFAVTALLASTVFGRQALDRRTTRLLRVWEEEGRAAALACAEALGAQEGEPRLAIAAPMALAARLADEVLAPTLFMIAAGLPGAALCLAVVVAGREADGRRNAFARAASSLRDWVIFPAAYVAGVGLAAAGGGSALRSGAIPRSTAPAEQSMLAALGEKPTEHSATLRRALSLYRRAVAFEIVALATLSIFSAFVL